MFVNLKELTIPMHWPTHGQWWSNLCTQLLQIEQWDARGGRYSKHVSQNFTLTEWPLTKTSFVLGSFKWGVLPFTHSIEGVVASNPSSESGGFRFLGTIPGSLPEVMKRNTKSYRKKKSVSSNSIRLFFPPKQNCWSRNGKQQFWFL